MTLQGRFTAAARPHAPNHAAELLSQLGAAHETLTRAIAMMDRMTSGTIDRTALAGARWRLSAANRARRAAWQDCHDHLLPLVDRSSAAALAELNDSDVEMARDSARHLARWSADAAEADWPAYCEASRTIRGRMSAAMKAEERLVYPLLRMQRLEIRRPS